MNEISTFLVMFELVIDFFLNFGDLVAKNKVKTKVLINFFNAMHDSSVIFDADFGGYFGGAETEFFRQKVHGDLAGGFDITDAGFATHFLGGEFEISGDFVNDLLRSDLVWSGGVDVFGDIFDGFGFNVGTHEFGFGAEDGAFVFEFGELEVESASPSETRSEAFVDGFDLGGEAIRGDDDLFVKLVEVVEDIEEFFLRFFLTNDELEIIDN